MGGETDYSEVDVESLYSLMREKEGKVQRSRRAGTDEAGLALLRTFHEEEYKQVMVPVLGYFLGMFVSNNDKSTSRMEIAGECFNAVAPPEISIEDYLFRIVKYTPCSKECFLLAMIYIDRLVQRTHFRLTSFNVHRILITGVMIASKLVDDNTQTNRYYSHVGGVAVQELNNLEIEFLCLLSYDLLSSSELFEQYQNQLEKHILKREEREVLKALDSTLLDCGRESVQESEPVGIQKEIGKESSHKTTRLLANTIRRSKSFTSKIAETQEKVWNWRKHRSSSFHVEVFA